ncbi:MAG: hypothetical protein VX899_13630 [Myxococcota bacterium]|nr:hypothetical protein [Myxococcota bacterium]
MQRTLLVGVGVLLGAVGLMLGTELQAQAQDAEVQEPVKPNCKRWKLITGADAQTIEGWMVAQQAKGRTQFVVPVADPGYSIMCAY